MLKTATKCRVYKQNIISDVYSTRGDAMISLIQYYLIGILGLEGNAVSIDHVSGLTDTVT